MKKGTSVFRAQTLNEVWDSFGSAEEIMVAFEAGSLELISEGFLKFETLDEIKVVAVFDGDNKLLWLFMSQSELRIAEPVLRKSGGYRVYSWDRALEEFPVRMRRELAQKQMLLRQQKIQELDLLSADLWIPERDLADMTLQQITERCLLGTPARPEKEDEEDFLRMEQSYRSFLRKELLEEPLRVIFEEEGKFLHGLMAKREVPKCEVRVISHIENRTALIVHKDDESEILKLLREKFQLTAVRRSWGTVAILRQRCLFPAWVKAQERTREARSRLALRLGVVSKLGAQLGYRAVRADEETSSAGREKRDRAKPKNGWDRVANTVLN